MIDNVSAIRSHSTLEIRRLLDICVGGAKNVRPSYQPAGQKKD